MSKTIKLKKGFDINLAGAPSNDVVKDVQPDTFALKPTDFPGMTRPKLLAKEGDNVKAGSPVFHDKVFEDVLYTAPVSGEIVEVKRGAKRKILEIKILADKAVEYESFTKHSVSDIKGLSKEDTIAQMCKGGVWPNIIQRPYGIVANSEESPKAIFISGFDTNPLAPSIEVLFSGQEQAFQAGIDILKKLTSGLVHLGINGKEEIPSLYSAVKGVQINKISGPHPAGNVGVQIHHIDPVNKGDLVWTVTPYGVIQIGKLFLEGKYDASKTIAVAGSEVSSPKYYSTYIGANAGKFLEGNLKQDHVRVVSGNVLSGNGIGKDGYLGYYHNALTVIPEGDYEELLGWILPSTSKLSFHKAFGLLSFLTPKKEFVLDTNTRGEPRAFVQSGEFEKVMPMDVMPTYLVKAILAEDYDDMEALGIYELVEEDIALCEFIDVSKHELQTILRSGLDLIRNG
ncbi:MAG: Na(+)-translocating NADH-quinone reductase subunit A [Cyclobacteriaceae bacterium]